MIGSLPTDQALAVLRWLFWLWVAGVLAQPLASVILPGQTGRAYVAAKVLGWLAMGFVPWVLASIPLISFQSSAPVVGIAALGISYLWLRGRTVRDRWTRIATTEAVFIGLFWLGLAMRLGTADLAGLEKFMDLGFTAAAMQADAMPPMDPWFAGHSINYYYFGHAQAGAWGLLANVAPDHAYQLAMATLFALTGLGVIQILRELLGGTGRAMANVMAGFGAALVLYAGNLHSFLYDVLRPWMGSTKSFFHMPDSTRFIGFDPPTEDKGFTEFPAYAFAVGDMHGHVLATPMVLLAILLGRSLFHQVRDLGAVGLPSAAAYGWLLALCYMTNSWDTAILGLLALILLAVAMAGHLKTIQWDRLAGAAVLCALTALVVAAPFHAGFAPFHDGPRWAGDRQTPLWQLLIVYGAALPGALAMVALAIDVRTREMVFAGGIALAAILFIALPEIVYIKDIYGADHTRANTMFKMSFRAQTLLQIAAVAAIGYLAARSLWSMAAGLAMALPLVATFSYASHIAKPPSVIQSLDGMAFLGDERPLVEAAMALPLAPGEVMLEAPGDSYTGAARISAMSGRPTVLGWIVHEWLWRGGYDPVRVRLEAVDGFYQTDDQGFQCRQIARYNIRYVVVGKEEKARYQGLNQPALRALGRIVMQTPAGEIIAVDRNRCLE